MESPSYIARYKSTIHTVIFDGIIVKILCFILQLQHTAQTFYIIICDHKPDDCEHGTIYTSVQKFGVSIIFFIIFERSFMLTKAAFI